MRRFDIRSSLWINKQKQAFFGKGRIELLKHIDDTGSLSSAAKIMKMSYKTAWDSLNAMNALSGTLLVESIAGGKGGGGSSLTPMAHLYIKLYEKIYDEQRDFFDSIENHMDDYDKLMDFLNRTSLRTSARNQIKGRVDNIENHDLRAVVTLDINGIKLLSYITKKSIEELSLKKNLIAYAVIKSSWIKILPKPKAGVNHFSGIISTVNYSDENSEIVATLKNNQHIVISEKSPIKKYKKGDEITIYIDQNDIIIGI